MNEMTNEMTERDESRARAEAAAARIAELEDTLATERARAEAAAECLEGCEACAASPESAPHYSLREMHARAERAEAALAALRENFFSAMDHLRAAEAALAALREVAVRVEASVVALLYGESMTVDADLTRLRRVIADTSAAAEAYRAKVRREALREAADRIGVGLPACAALLRAWADEEGTR